MFTANKVEIELFGQKVFLSERMARDVNNLIDFSAGNNNRDYNSAVYEAVIVLRDGLRINLRFLKWYQFIKRYQIKKWMNIKNKFLLGNLTPREIFSFAEKVYELEGIDLKKKIPDQAEKSAEELETHF